MDPQKLSQLDPKLRDAYQRVMGTPIPQPQAQPASPRGEPIQAQTPPMPTPPPMPDPTPAPTPTPDPSPEPTPPPPSEPAPTIQEPPVPQPEPPTPQPPVFEPQPAIPQPEPAISPEPPVQPTNFAQMNSEVAAGPSTPNFTAPAPQAQTITLKKKQGMMTPILFGIVGLVFIVIYTLFWTKIFNFKLPFLP